MTKARKWKSSRGERGFTFVEVLVVMGIIAVLAGMSVVGLNLLSKRKPQFITKTRIEKLVAAVGSWKQSFEAYPPSDITRIQRLAGGAKPIKKAPNQTNEGIEALYQALYWDTYGRDPELGDEEIGNTDEDELAKAATKQGTVLWEVVDGWGNPIIFFLHTDYARAADSPPIYVTAQGDDVAPVPWKYEKEGREGFAQPSSFQFFSMGPDGEPNTEDDIKSW